MLAALVDVEARGGVDGHGAGLRRSQWEHRHHQRLVSKLAMPAAQRATHPACHASVCQSATNDNQLDKVIFIVLSYGFRVFLPCALFYNETYLI